MELADQLGVDQLALEPIGVLLDREGGQARDRIGDAAIEPAASRGLLERVADVEVGPADAVAAELGADAEQAVDDDPIVGGDRLVARLRDAGEAGIQRRLLERVAGAPAVVVADAGDQADAAAANLGRRAAADFAGEIGRHVAEPLQRAWSAR